MHRVELLGIAAQTGGWLLDQAASFCLIRVVIHRIALFLHYSLHHFGEHVDDEREYLELDLVLRRRAARKRRGGRHILQ